MGLWEVAGPQNHDSRTITVQQLNTDKSEIILFTHASKLKNWHTWSVYCKTLITQLLHISADIILSEEIKKSSHFLPRRVQEAVQ